MLLPAGGSAGAELRRARRGAGGSLLRPREVRAAEEGEVDPPLPPPGFVSNFKPERIFLLTFNFLNLFLARFVLACNLFELSNFF